TWNAPPDGGSPITSYLVVASPGGASVTTAASPTSAVVTGLTNGTAYTFTVSATNNVGTGAPSSPSNSVTPEAPAAAPTTYKDFTYNSKITLPPTADQPQSKLWYHDGAWWALMASPSDSTIHVFELKSWNHTWRDTNTRVDARSDSTGDALSIGSTLYVLSRSPSSKPILNRLTYDSSKRLYVIDHGFPVSIGKGASESITIARDSTGRLWATFTSDSKVWVMHSTSDDRTWTAPFVPPVGDTNIDPDDISTIISFSGKIGLL